MNYDSVLVFILLPVSFDYHSDDTGWLQYFRSITQHFALVDKTARIGKTALWMLTAWIKQF